MPESLPQKPPKSPINCYKMYLITNRSNISACKCYEKAGLINKADDEIIYVYDFKTSYEK